MVKQNNVLAGSQYVTWVQNVSVCFKMLQWYKIQLHIGHRLLLGQTKRIWKLLARYQNILQIEKCYLITNAETLFLENY